MPLHASDTLFKVFLSVGCDTVSHPGMTGIGMRPYLLHGFFNCTNLAVKRLHFTVILYIGFLHLRVRDPQTQPLLSFLWPDIIAIGFVNTKKWVKNSPQCCIAKYNSVGGCNLRSGSRCSPPVSSPYSSIANHVSNLS